MGLAKLYDDKFADSILSSSSWGAKAPTVVPRFLSQSTALPPLLPNPPGPKTQYTIKKLTSAKMLARREKGLCYNCDEKFFVGHKCKGQLFLFLTEDVGLLEDGGMKEMDCNKLTMNQECALPEISLHAMAGQVCPHTLRLKDKISGFPVQTLVDGGSTHNFIQARLVKFLKIPIVASSHFRVLIGNGESMECMGTARRLPFN